jgi:hypothetical protein
LIVELPELDREVNVKVAGSTAGFEGWQWRRRKEPRDTHADVVPERPANVVRERTLASIDKHFLGTSRE